MTDAKSAVIASNLERRFGEFVAVNRISLDIKAGEVFGFLGPNGAGKSTTIRMLCGILSPTAGQASVAGFDLRTQVEQVKQHIGYMSQRFSLYEELTVEENIDFFSGIYRIPKTLKQERKSWVLQMAGLKDRGASRVSQLPGGWKQRLALGCAILHQPPVLFLDEPTSGVDVNSRRRFWDLIYQMSSDGVTIFVTTHYMDEAEYCDRIALIYRGAIIASGGPTALKEQYMPEDVIDVQCERPQDALDEVARIPGVREAALFGSGLHLVAGDGAQLTPIVYDILNRKGFHPRNVVQIVPSLEDVFVSLIEAHDRDSAPESEVKQ